MAASSFRKSPIAVAVALVLSSCALLPPGMRSKGAAPATPAVSAAVPAPAPVAPPAVAPEPVSPEPAAKIFRGTGNFIAPILQRPPPPPGPEEASLNFEALDVREVAKVILGDYLKESYTVHPAVAGTVTFRTVRPIAMKDLLPTLEMLLRQNGAAVVREENIYKILPVAAVRGSVSPQLGGVNFPLPQGFGVVVVPLKYIGAQEMLRLLEPFAPENAVRIDPIRNIVIFAGNQRELRHLVETVEMFDVDWLAGYSLGIFPVKSTDVKSMVGDLEKVFGPAAASPLAGIVRVIPIERMNALVVVTTQPRYLEMAKTWIERIDQIGSTSGGTRFFVYQVRNGKAENLAQLIGDLFSTRRSTTTAPSLSPGSRPTEIRSAPFGQTTPPAQTTTTTITPSPGAATFQIPGGVTGGTTASEVRVIADKDTNSLLILATPGDYEVITNALRQLDVVRRQVLVEVLLAEVTLTDELRFGIDWFIRTRNNTSGVLNFGGLPPGGPILGPNNAVPFPHGGLQLINLTGGQVRAVLNTFGTEGKTRILASPQIMVLDNEKAEIKVGDRISVQTQSQTGVSTGTGVLNSFQYLETGILLAVTPRINSGGMVTLEINQEVSQPSGSGTAVNPNPNVSTRNAKTSVVVANGESIVLGGLIRENTLRDSSGLPLLSKIPVLGALFGEQGIKKDRTELILMVTPKIVSDPYQTRDVSEELKRKLPSLEKMLPPVKSGPPEGMPPPSELQK